MKKDKHITINIDSWQYSILNEIAEKRDRNITNLCYIVIKDFITIEASKKGYISAEYTTEVLKQDGDVF